MWPCSKMDHSLLKELTSDLVEKTHAHTIFLDLRFLLVKV